MEEKKKFPSLPSNYVTLQQLQERRLKEQEQMQKEKEEEEERRRKLLEEQRLKQEKEIERQKEEEKRKLYETQRAQAIEAKTSDRSNRRNPPNFSQRKRRIGKEIGSEVQKGGGGVVETGIAADVGISDEGRKLEESKQKKKGWKKSSKKKTMSRKTESESDAGVLEQSQAENGHEGNQIPIEPNEENKRVRKNKKKMESKMKEEEASTRVVEEEPENGLVERNTVDGAKKPVRVRRIRGGIWQGIKGTGDDKAARASGVKKDPVNVTVKVVEITQDLGDLAMADNHEQKKEEMNDGGRLRFRAGSGSRYGRSMFRRGRLLVDGRMSRDGGLMWVKKGEISDGNGMQEAKANVNPGSRIHTRRPASSRACRVPLEMI